MTSARPIISVIIPVDDSGALLRLLDGLRAQTYPLHQVEILIVATGDTDDLVELCRPYGAELPLRLIEPGGQTIVEALNCGVAAASGKLLLFLDNHVEPTPPLIEAHIQMHQARPGCVVIGAYTITFPDAAGFLTITLRSWWEDRFYAMRRSGHRYSYRDIVDGNFSVETGVFTRAGGFDPAFEFGAEYELALRLIKAGSPFIFAVEAKCNYYETYDLEQAFHRACQEGQLNLLMGCRYPELESMSPDTYFGKPRFSRKHRLHRVVHTLAFSQSGPGEFVATCLGRLLPLIEKARLRRQWRLLFRSLCIFWYWRGMAKEADRQLEISGSRQGNPAQTGVDASEIELDL
ncbi:MAG TPA: glycosyltransferase, partial [Anaerolineae bacterium]